MGNSKIIKKTLISITILGSASMTFLLLGNREIMQKLNKKGYLWSEAACILQVILLTQSGAFADCSIITAAPHHSPLSQQLRNQNESLSMRQRITCIFKCKKLFLLHQSQPTFNRWIGGFEDGLGWRLGDFETWIYNFLQNIHCFNRSTKNQNTNPPHVRD